MRQSKYHKTNVEWLIHIRQGSYVSLGDNPRTYTISRKQESVDVMKWLEERGYIVITRRVEHQHDIYGGGDNINFDYRFTDIGYALMEFDEL